MEKICKFCGLPFESNNSSIYCNRQHFEQCIICGRQFTVPKSMLGTKERRHTCSRKCSSELRKRTVVNKYGSLEEFNKHKTIKTKNTNKIRYGVENPQSLDSVREKTKKTCLEKYGAESFLQSDQHKQTFDEVRKTDEYKKKVRDSYELTMKKRYGEDWGKHITDKMVESYKNKTGYDFPSQDPNVQKKVVETNQQRYGKDRPMQNEEIKHKAIDTWKSKYGHDGVDKQNLIDKTRRTMIERYGVENTFQQGPLRDKMYLDYKQKTGYDYPSQNPEVRKKIEKGYQEKYGVNHPMKSSSVLKQYILKPDKIENWMKFKENPVEYLNNKPTLINLSKTLGVHATTIGYYIHDHNLEDYITWGPNKHTSIEEEVVEELYKIDPELVIIQNDRKTICPKEIDILLPEYNVGIEVDPTATHNHTLNIYDGGKGLPISYHRIKSDMCKEKNIFLFHIFGYDWTHNKEIIISMIRNLIGENKTIIYARKCEIRDVDYETSRSFLLSNHRQGSASSPIRLGLFYQNNLVSLMTFGKIRNTIGTGKEDLSDCYELVRFCNLKNTSVVGGASKLFNYFIKNYNPFRIRSFSDIAHTRGNLYKTLGFEDIRISEPNYVWVDWKTDKAYHRTNAQKQNIKKFLDDNTINLSESETAIMVEHGFVQFFDCGTILWEWSKTC